MGSENALDNMKLWRVTINGALLTRYNTNPRDFHFRTITCDETWLKAVLSLRLQLSYV